MFDKNQYQREWCRRNKDKIKSYNLRYVKSHPWIRFYNYAQQRCRRGSYKKFGIQFYMILEEFKFLWFKDKAYLMKRPSIDRKNTFGNYEIDNCRFIELKVHRKRKQPRKLMPIYQYDKNGNFIKRWDGRIIAEKALGMCNGSIRSCLIGRYKSSGGYIWRSA